MAEYAETLRNLYADLGITVDNATDDLDKLVLTNDVLMGVIVHK